MKKTEHMNKDTGRTTREVHRCINHILYQGCSGNFSLWHQLRHNLGFDPSIHDNAKYPVKEIYLEDGTMEVPEIKARMIAGMAVPIAKQSFANGSKEAWIKNIDDVAASTAEDFGSDGCASYRERLLKDLDKMYDNLDSLTAENVLDVLRKTSSVLKIALPAQGN